MAGRYRCRLCGRAFPTRLALRIHIRERHPLLRYYLPEVILATALIIVLAAGLALASTPKPPAATSPEAGSVTLTTTLITIMTATGEAGAEAPKAPDFQLREYGSDRVIGLGDLAGKPVFLEFFSPFCPHCRSMMPIVEQLYERYGDRIAFILISYGEEGLSEVREEYGLRPIILVDPDGRAFASYDVKYVPTFMVLDREHRIIWSHVGGLGIEELESALEGVLQG